MRERVEKLERYTDWREHHEWSYALGRDSIKQPMLLRRRPEADGPRVEAVACDGIWPVGQSLPEHDPAAWQPAMLVGRSVAA